MCIGATYRRLTTGLYASPKSLLCPAILMIMGASSVTALQYGHGKRDLEGEEAEGASSGNGEFYVRTMETGTPRRVTVSTMSCFSSHSPAVVQEEEGPGGGGGGRRQQRRGRVLRPDHGDEEEAQQGGRSRGGRRLALWQKGALPCDNLAF